MSRLAGLARRLAVVGALAAFTFGLPVALGRAVGWPLPSRWPAADEVWQRLGEAYIADGTIIKILAVVVWLAWAQLVVCLALEVAARARGRSPTNLPLAGPAQALAGWLVGGLLLTSSVSGGRPSSVPPLASAIARTQTIELATAVAERPAPPPSPTTIGERPSETYRVVPGDNLWDIAEACGSPLGQVDGRSPQAAYNTRVAELVGQIFDLNEGREQPDGRWLRKPSLIRPGWILALPDGAHVQVGSTSAPEVSPPMPAVGELRHQSSDATVETEAARSADGLGPDPAVMPTATDATPPVAPDATRSTAPPQRQPQRPLRDGPSASALGVAAAGLGVGLAQALRMRRRRVTSRSRPGAAATPLDPEFEELRSTIAQSDDQDQVGALAGALRDLAAHLVRIKSPARPRLIQSSRRGVEFLLSASALPAPPGWHPQASGAVWVCPHPPKADDGGCPAPALVTLGREEGGTSLHLDLETEGCVSVVGEKDAVVAFGRSIMVELAHSPLADTLAVVVVGALEGAEVSLEKTSSASTWADILEMATAWAHQSSQALAANRWASGLHGRASGRSNDAISPLVVLAASTPNSDELAALQNLPMPSTLTIVALGWDMPIATRIEVDDRELRIPALGISCAPQGLAPATVHAVGAVLEEAESPLIAGPPLPTSSVVDVDLRDPYVDPPHEILVRVLGDIEVVGGRRPLSPLQTAAVAYIALHSPVTASRVEDAVWTSPTANRHKRLANTVSEARAALGPQHFPVATDGRYSVGPAVTTDLNLFERRVAYAASQPGPDAIETLGGALELVRGPLFSYRSAERASFVWVDLENWAVTAELAVVDAALRLGELCLGSGDAAGAVHAATTGLTVSPAHTGLTELLMRAHAAAGDRHAAGLVFENHVNALQALELDHVDDSILNLRAALLGGSVRGA